MNLKSIRILLIFAAVLLITACADKEAKKEQKEEVVEAVKQEKKANEKVAYPIAATDPEEIVQQAKGIKEAAVTKELMADFEAEGMTLNEIYNGLVHWFAADYQEAYAQLSGFEPDYGELDITKNEENKVKNIAFHLDSSGSMAAAVPGGIKMDLSKGALKQYASGLPSDSLISLRVYGHKGTGSDSDKELSCSSTEMMYSASTYDDATFSSALEKFKPSGWTPLATSIQKAYEDLKATATDQTENILFVVSDGIETCDGNPVEEARKLAESDLNIKVNIIGFNVDDEGHKQLKETAEAGNGEYFTVNSNIDLTNTIDQLLTDARKSYESNFRKAGMGTKVNFRLVEITDEIADLGYEFNNVLEEENSLLSDAAYELYLAEKITEEDNAAIEQLIEQRYESLRQFKETLLQKANEKNELKHQELISIITNS